MRVKALGLLRDICIVAIGASLKDSDDLPSNHRWFCRWVDRESNDKMVTPNQNRDMGASTFPIKCSTVAIWVHRVSLSVIKSHQAAFLRLHKTYPT